MSVQKHTSKPRFYRCIDQLTTILRPEPHRNLTLYFSGSVFTNLVLVATLWTITTMHKQADAPLLFWFIEAEACRAKKVADITRVIRPGQCGSLRSSLHTILPFISVSYSVTASESAADAAGTNLRAVFNDKTPVGKATSSLWLRIGMCINLQVGY